MWVRGGGVVLEVDLTDLGGEMRLIGLKKRPVIEEIRGQGNSKMSWKSEMIAD